MKKAYLSIKEAAEYLGVSADTLRRWHNNGVFRATLVTPGKHRLYSLADLQMRTKGIVQMAKDWAGATEPYEPIKEWYCQTSDVFKARLERLAMEMESNPALKSIAPLVSSAAGEIGNNAFDHNLGNWPDVPGAFFAYDLGKRVLVIADRGRGILRTLRTVRPSLPNNAEALRIAFTEVITGRAPEKRGNGLKYVSKVAKLYGFTLQLQSGDAAVIVNKDTDSITAKPADAPIRGCLCTINF